MNAFVDYYRCPPDRASIGTHPQLSSHNGYFKFGDTVAFGRFAGGAPAAYSTDALADVSDAVTMSEGRPYLPFDLSDVATSLREERYRQNGHNWLQRSAAGEAARRVYYALRPFMGVAVRKHLQKAHLSGWEKIQFPRWP